jgi:hypothetical protein
MQLIRIPASRKALRLRPTGTLATPSGRLREQLATCKLRCGRACAILATPTCWKPGLSGHWRAWRARVDRRECNQQPADPMKSRYSGHPTGTQHGWCSRREGVCPTLTCGPSNKAAVLVRPGSRLAHWLSVGGAQTSGEQAIIQACQFLPQSCDGIILLCCSPVRRHQRHEACQPDREVPF